MNVFQTPSETRLPCRYADFNFTVTDAITDQGMLSSVSAINNFDTTTMGNICAADIPCNSVAGSFATESPASIARSDTSGQRPTVARASGKKKSKHKSLVVVKKKVPCGEQEAAKRADALARATKHPTIMRGGGAPSIVNQKGKAIEVELDANDLAMFTKKPGLVIPMQKYTDFISSLEEYRTDLEATSYVVRAGGAEFPPAFKHRPKLDHPWLGVMGMVLGVSKVNELATLVFGRQTNPTKALSKLNCDLGMSTNTKSTFKTMMFDPTAWNKRGYRLEAGGDSSGGKPEIIYK